MSIKPGELQIVLVGSFNPSIFHPAWFALNEVISQEHAVSSEVGVVHNEVASMTLGNQIKVSCEANRFQVEVSKAPEIILLDLVSRFLEICFLTRGCKALESTNQSISAHLLLRKEQRLVGCLRRLTLGVSLESASKAVRVLRSAD